MSNRYLIINVNHRHTADYYLEEMKLKNLLIYRADHTYKKGTEFLLSNEFDWYKSQIKKTTTDVVIGFGTNALWDISVLNQAKSMVVADWSPWPLIAHAFILSPLIRISKSPAELIFRISGMPGKDSAGLLLQEAFSMAKRFTLSKLSDQKIKVIELLNELAENSELTDSELKFLTTFFRPRLGDNLNPQNGFGPFYDLKSPNTANLTYYLEQRYSPDFIGDAQSALSSNRNFEYLQSMFSTGPIKYALTDVMDLRFYEESLHHYFLQNLSHFSLSFSNLFDCEHYNGLNAESFAGLKTQLQKLFTSKRTFLYRTEGKTQPYRYYLDDLN